MPPAAFRSPKVCAVPAGPTFLYDFNSPFAYLAASRVDEVLPVAPRWQPIAFAFVLRARDRIPWSMREQTRAAGIRECESRARAYGLPPLQWPSDWPVGSYSLLALRAALVADELGRLRQFSRAAFTCNFVTGAGLRTAEDVLGAAGRAELDVELVGERMASEEIKQRLRAVTDDAIARGVYGVPTVVVGQQLFWGDDRLGDAAAAYAG